MDNAKQHWKILQELGSDLANRVRSFLVVGKGGEGVIIATEDGEGFWLGKMWFGRGKTKTLNEPTPLDVPELVHMAQSDNHILLLNRRGKIYSMGKNNHGQLGLGYVDKKAYFSPQLISSSQKFISVRCGIGHSVALTEDGKVWAWGCNDCGQVGVPSSNVFIPSLRQIPELDLHRVIAVECGGHHSLALTDQGEVYVWGWNYHGPHDLRNWSSGHTLTRIPTTSPVQSMAAGLHHTLLLTQTGEVYAFGDNGYGQRGFARDLPPINLFDLTHSRPTHSRPTISSLSSKIEGLPLISQIASHPATFLSIAMSPDHRCFVWGKLHDKTSISTQQKNLDFPRELPPVYSTVESPLSSFSTHRCTPHSVTILETPPSRLSAKMSRMFDNPVGSDVQFLVEQKTIHAHRIILSNFSDYFALMFSERWLAPVDPEDPIVKVTIPDHSYQVFYAFLRFIYTDCFKLNPDLLPELFVLASQYLESDLEQLCLSRMRTTITSATSCLYYQFTLQHPMPKLFAFHQELVQFISANFHQVITTAAYQSMDDELCKKLTLSMAALSS